MMTALTNIIILGAVIKDKESFLQKLNFISYNTNLELKIEKRMFQSRGYFRFSLALSDCMYGHVHFIYYLRRLFLALVPGIRCSKHLCSNCLLNDEQ